MSPSIRKLLALFGAKSHARARTGMVAAIVAFDRDEAAAPPIGETEELAITGRLHAALETAGCGQFDGADRTASTIKWFFFGDRADDLEATLLDALRTEPSCRNAVLRVSERGIAGPWRETRI
jgi:hypothetical protein